MTNFLPAMSEKRDSIAAVPTRIVAARVPVTARCSRPRRGRPMNSLCRGHRQRLQNALSDFHIGNRQAILQMITELSAFLPTQPAWFLEYAASSKILAANDTLHSTPA